MYANVLLLLLVYPAATVAIKNIYIYDDICSWLGSLEETQSAKPAKPC